MKPNESNGISVVLAPVFVRNNLPLALTVLKLVFSYCYLERAADNIKQSPLTHINHINSYKFQLPIIPLFYFRTKVPSKLLNL